MCDTLVALRNSTADGSILFAKNSDRDPNEGHYAMQVEAADHERGENVQCTYIEIPQVQHTHKVLLAKPYWIWGAEMGSNEYGVVIGNEAVFSKETADKKPGLIGMDYLRLALERADTAYTALQVITGLLKQYGQSGNCGLAHPLYYHNSFLIADNQEAWVLETVGKQWAAEKVRDIRSISNCLSIHDLWDMASDDLIYYAQEKGWHKKGQKFDFARCYSDLIYTTFADGHRRQNQTSQCLFAQNGKISVGFMMNLLRSHGTKTDAKWTPVRAVAGQDVCAHAGFGPIRISQTTGSMVSQLGEKNQTHWITGTSTPCTAIFKPVWLDAGLPDQGITPSNIYDKNSLWWQHELLQREVQRDYPKRLAAFCDERDEIEKKYINEADEVKNLDATERHTFSSECFREARESTKRWINKVQSMKIESSLPLYHAAAWNDFNKKAKLTLS
jgi:secernin